MKKVKVIVCLIGLLFLFCTSAMAADNIVPPAKAEQQTVTPEGSKRSVEKKAAEKKAAADKKVMERKAAAERMAAEKKAAATKAVKEKMAPVETKVPTVK